MVRLRCTSSDAAAQNEARMTRSCCGKSELYTGNPQLTHSLDISPVGHELFANIYTRSQLRGVSVPFYGTDTSPSLLWARPTEAINAWSVEAYDKTKCNWWNNNSLTHARTHTHTHMQAHIRITTCHLVRYHLSIRHNGDLTKPLEQNTPLSLQNTNVPQFIADLRQIMHREKALENRPQTCLQKRKNKI